jgi:DNA-binding protein HU-beta
MAENMTKTELVARVAASTGQSQATVASVVDAMFTTIAEAVGGGAKVTVPGWLSVEQVKTAARTGRNPRTGEEIKIAAGTRVKVTAGSKLKAAGK